MVEKKEYIQMMKKTAREMWGKKGAEKAGSHIEATAGAVWRIWRKEIDPMNEPATKLRHRDNT